MRSLKNFYDDQSGIFATVRLPKRLRGCETDGDDRFTTSDEFRNRYYRKFPYNVHYNLSLMVKLFGENFKDFSSSGMSNRIRQKFREEFVYKFKGPICHESWYFNIRFMLAEDAILFKMLVS